jgi:hypothetical protein
MFVILSDGVAAATQESKDPYRCHKPRCDDRGASTRGQLLPRSLSMPAAGKTILFSSQPDQPSRYLLPICHYEGL